MTMLQHTDQQASLRRGAGTERPLSPVDAGAASRARLPTVTSDDSPTGRTAEVEAERTSWRAFLDDAQAVVAARWCLRHVDVVGARVRAFGRPIVRNAGT